MALSSLRSIPLGSDSILCGDSNARLGDLTGDSIRTPRGTDLVTFCEQQDLQVLNSSLSYGVSTFNTFRRGVVHQSIIDLFITNIPSWNIKSPSLVIDSDLSLGSDHRLMHLCFEYDTSLGSGGNRASGNDTVAALSAGSSKPSSSVPVGVSFGWVFVSFGVCSTGVASQH